MSDSIKAQTRYLPTTPDALNKAAIAAKADGVTATEFADLSARFNNMVGSGLGRATTPLRLSDPGLYDLLDNVHSGKMTLPSAWQAYQASVPAK